MIIDVAERNRLSKETKYKHNGLGIIKTNSSTKKIEEETKNRLKLRVSYSNPKLLQKKDQIVYNKWYILPELRYKNKSQNPKQNIKIIADEEHIYKNLRNHEFWNWMHPFQQNTIECRNPEYMENADPKVLQGFKRYVQESERKRIPSVVHHVLAKKKKSSN